MSQSPACLMSDDYFHHSWPSNLVRITIYYRQNIGTMDLLSDSLQSSLRYTVSVKWEKASLWETGRPFGSFVSVSAQLFLTFQLLFSPRLLNCSDENMNLNLTTLQVYIASFKEVSHVESFTDLSHTPVWLVDLNKHTAPSSDENFCQW